MTEQNGNAVLEQEPERLESVLGSVTNRTPGSSPARRDGDVEKTRRETEWAAMKDRIGERYHASAGFSNFNATHDSQKRIAAAVRGYAENWTEHQRRGDGVLLYGPVGTGKDHLAVAAMRMVVLDFGGTAAWADGQTFYAEMRDRISAEGSEAMAIRPYTAADVLLISDPLPGNADKPVTDFQQSVLWRIIDRRYRNLKPTWVTMNVASSDEAASRLSQQIVDRLGDGALICHCNWPSARKPATVVK